MLSKYLGLIKFSHTVFALPFALIGFFLGVKSTDRAVDWRLFALVLICMVAARSAAMAFNRWLDRDIDSKNPRTVGREIPSGQVTEKGAFGLVVLSSAVFVAATFFINRLCFWLSPVALAVVLGYSFTKRFTWLCHFVLGLGLGLAPVGAFLAVTGRFEIAPIIYGFAVLFWVAGFDVIYALQDDDFDRSQGLFSIPSFLGRANALRLARLLHLFSAGLIVAATFWLLKSWPETFGGLLIFGNLAFLAALFYQHTLVKSDDLSRVNLAFFTTNGLASVVFGSFWLFDFWV